MRLFKVWDYLKSKVKPDRQYEQKFSPKSYKTVTKIIANPEFAISSFEQPDPDCYLSEHSQQIPLMISQQSKIAVISRCMVLLFTEPMLLNFWIKTCYKRELPWILSGLRTWVVAGQRKAVAWCLAEVTEQCVSVTISPILPRCLFMTR